MNIFASMTAQVQFVLVGPDLFTRGYSENCKPAGEWQKLDLTEELSKLKEFESKRKSRARHNVDQYYFSCLRACISDDVHSGHFLPSKSTQIEMQIDALTSELELARIAEAEDLPKVESDE
jgi:hypothetical protein